MARVQTMAGEMLVPPDELDLSFLPDGLLESETDIDRAKPLGVRPFTVDNVLDRLNGIDDMNGIDDTHDDRALLFRFLWGLLHRARESGFGTQHSSERATSFDPSAWFWCRPGRAREDENARLQQQRARYLAAVPVPCRDGKWRTASRVAFGTDWAEWLENGAIGNPTSRAVCQRIQAYHALEKISPGSHALLASPHVLIPYLAPPDQLISNAGADAEDVMDNHQLNAERHAFLLRLGVWEVPPIEAFESRDPRDRKNFPWSDSAAVRQQAAVAAGGGWTFGLDGWSGMRHHNVYLAEDYRFAWPLEELAERDATALMVGLQYGAKLYAERFGALVFCPRCSDSGSSHSRAARHSSALDGYPSLLALQLRYDRWVMYTLDGSALQPPQEPASVWWHQKPPTGAGLRQSAYRFLRLCSPSTEMTDELRRLAGIHTLEDASYEALRSLLPELRLYRDQPPPSVTSVTSGSARQAFVSLHRLVYERLAELAGERAHDVTALLAETGILCEIGEDLVYRPPAEAYHDDGRFATYIRHFLGHIPLAVLARDRGVTADRLGIQPLVIQLARRGNDQGRDVTGELRTMLGDRFSELLSIVVHHSLGTQTLGLTSQQFEVRARRLQALTVRQLDDLVIDASIAGCPFHVTIGEGSGQDLFLENPTAAMPVLFHDLSGDGWQDRVRRKLGPHLATVLENPAYAATFALLLQAETEAEREEYLLGLGISSAEVDAVATHLGVVDAEERRRFARWFLAILRSQGTQRKEYELDLDPEGLVSMLVDAGIPQDVAHCLVDIGGGESVRRDTSKGSALRLLADLGIDPRALDTHLRQLDDPGLSIAVAYQMLRQWLHLHGRQCAVVLATRQPDKVAKAAMQMIEPPSEVVLSIEPALAQVLEPVAALLQTAGVIVPTELLASDPEGQLARAGGFESVADLNQATHLFYSPEERRRALRELAAQWRRELRVLAVLARTGPTETHTRIRAIDETVCAMLPAHPSQPSELRAVLDELFSEHGGLAQGLAELLTDSVPGIVKPRENLLTLAKQHGVAVDCLAAVERALDAPRRDQAREIKRRTERLAEHGLTPLPPVGLQPLSSKPTTSVRSPKKVVAIKVRESHDRRKRELGDEGEQWALAAVLDKFLSADIAMRDKAVDEVVALLQGFEGKPVDAALSHAELVRARDVDDAEFIDALTGLLHVSRHSDAFGFDLIGWLAPSVGAEPQAMCLEVKSSGDGGFHLTSGEWALAKDLHDDDQGDRYAVLVVRRGKDGGVPASLDLLVNPVALVHSGQLRQEVDGYQIAYRSQA